MTQPFETMLQESLSRRINRVDAKIQNYLLRDDKVKLRKYQRARWAIVGIKHHGFEFNVIRIVHTRFKDLDLVILLMDPNSIFEFMELDPIILSMDPYSII